MTFPPIVRRLVATGSVLLLILFPVPLASSPAGPPSSAHTHVRLLADVQSIRPGHSFNAGILLSMDEGWHTYWINPGEAGLPTTVTWNLPEGFSADSLQWPLPQKHIETGNVLTYGFSSETMLLATVRVPDRLPPGSSVTLRGDVSWLECERICVPGSAHVELTLPVSDAPPQAANARLFARYAAEIPVQLSALPGLHVTTAADSGTVTLRVSRDGRPPLVVSGSDMPDFYPEPLAGISFGRTSAEVHNSECTIRLPVTPDGTGSAPAVLRGILVTRFGGSAPRGAKVEIQLPAKFLAGLTSTGGVQQQTSILDQTFNLDRSRSTQPIALILLFAFIGGLLLNIMPCVLPVIALKVFGLVRMAGDRPGRIRTLGGMFSLGIVASFLALALLVIVLQAAGQQVGWGFQFQEPLFVIAMSAVVFAFGLSLFGVYEIRLPSSAVTGVSAAVSRQEEGGHGYAASFSEGVFATILATPCTAPFLGTALGFAFAQPWWMILVIFTVVAFGMALPYLLLTSRPAWVRFLPKPGDWMVTAKQFMGFLMMATLLWLLYILGRQLGMEGVIWTSAFLLTVAVACWLVGRFATLTASRRTIVLTWIAALAIVAGGYWFFLESILDVRAVIAGTATSTSSGETSAAGGIEWKPFTIAGLDQELRGDRPVFVDFTAEWCLTCKVNEKGVLADHAVIAKFRSAGIVPFRADWTNRNPDITRLLQKFGRSGVPLYVVFPRGKRDSPIVLPEVITTGIVLDALGRAAGDGS